MAFCYFTNFVYHMKNNILNIVCGIMLLSVIAYSCNRDKGFIEANLNKKVFLNFIDSVIIDNHKIDWHSYREMHPFVSIIYVDENCGACCSKFANWRKMKPQELFISPKHRYLLIFRGEHYKLFKDNCLRSAHVMDCFIDSSFRYIKTNSDLSRQLINAKILVNVNNRIKQIDNHSYEQNVLSETIKIVERNQ